MNMCNEGHEMIVYEVDECPVCKAIDDQLRFIESLEVFARGIIDDANAIIDLIKDSREEER
jgi:hypothetical protein